MPLRATHAEEKYHRPNITTTYRNTKKPTKEQTRAITSLSEGLYEDEMLERQEVVAFVALVLVVSLLVVVEGSETER